MDLLSIRMQLTAMLFEIGKVIYYKSEHTILAQILY